MKPSVLIVIVILILGVVAAYQSVSYSQQNESLRVEAHRKLRHMPWTDQEAIRLESVTAATSYGIDPAGLEGKIQRTDRTGMEDAMSSVGAMVPGEKRYLEAAITYSRPILLIPVHYELRAAALKVENSHPQQPAMQEALRDLLPGR